ncbi:tripartite tricarboxylate transporter TctB family protein [Georhizobium sp. MAB10]|uniref:tripartite tricarboxylate transporter TctB family protein n=1 Tax=Georhizobium sp. MAB10 TaxID=3028319 RepID=UPI00385608F2
MSTDKNASAPEGADGRTDVHSMSALPIDLLVCFSLIATGCWFVVSATALPAGRSAITPATFPTIAGVLLMVLSLLQAVISFRKRATSEPVEFERPVSVAMAMVLMLLLPEAVSRMGFYPVIVVWTLAFGWFAGMRSFLHFAITLGIILFLARFIFEMMLGTPLP